MLKICSFVLAVSLLWCCQLTALSQELPPPFASPDVFVRANLRGEGHVSLHAMGDLNGDRFEDWVGVIHREPKGSAPTYQLYVLLRDAAGGYRLAVQSTEAQIAGMGCCWLEDLRVSNGSIYVQNNAKTAYSMEAAIHQFKLYKGEWRLVGLKIYYSDLRPKSLMDTDTDMNVLTGAVLEKKARGNRKPIVRRSRKKFPTSLLKDFDFSNGFGVEGP